MNGVVNKFGFFLAVIENTYLFLCSILMRLMEEGRMNNIGALAFRECYK